MELFSELADGESEIFKRCFESVVFGGELEVEELKALYFESQILVVDLLFVLVGLCFMLLYCLYNLYNFVVFLDLSLHFVCS